MDFYQILSDFSILDFSVGTALGLSSQEFVYNLVDEIVLPIIFVIFATNRKTIKSKVFTFRSVSFNWGELLISFIKYLTLLIIIILFLSYVIKPVSEKVIEHKTQLHRDGLDKLDLCLQKLDRLDHDLDKVEQAIQKDQMFGKQIEMGTGLKPGKL